MSAATLSTLKVLHILLACLSAAGFGLRGYWMLRAERDRLLRRWVRIAPHIVDTALLVCGLGLAVGYRLSPLDQPWFAAKMLALVAYIVFGGIAVRRARAGKSAMPWLPLAVLCLVAIFASAIAKRPLGVF